MIELKRKGLIFLSSNTASNSNNKLDYFSTELSFLKWSLEKSSGLNTNLF